MVVLNKIYTRTGDDGTTALGTGERVRKDGLRVSAYGTVDEANAAIGIARLKLTDAHQDVADALLRIQNDLFDLGADLCVPDRGDKLAWEPLRISTAQVDRLESEIDAMNAEMEPLASFILPGGTPAAADLHLARTIARRAERMMVELAAEPDEPVSEPAKRFLNRLSDYLFVAARFVNDRGRSDVLWVKGENR
ncbi:MAG: cob(I)yrinic acid a,c-diamide adenosyltransferase [Pseudomonadota bacterium]